MLVSFKNLFKVFTFNQSPEGSGRTLKNKIEIALFPIK